MAINADPVAMTYPEAMEILLGRCREALEHGHPRELVKRLGCGELLFLAFVGQLTAPQFQQLLGWIDEAAARHAASEQNEAEQLIEKLAADPKLARAVAAGHTRWARDS